MAEVFAGCLLERLPNPRAAGALPFFEYAPRNPLPTLATLVRYRKQLSGKAKIALVAPRSTWHTPRGAMRPGAEVDAGIDWLTRVSDILDAFAIVLATGAELTTGERDRDLLAAFAAKLAPTGRRVIVAPRGLWEPEQAVPFAKMSGTIYGFDPLEHDAPPGEFVYARVHPMGARPRLTEGHLAQIAARLAASDCAEGYVCIESERALQDMKRLTLALAEANEASALAALAGGEEEELDEDEDDLDEDDEELEEGDEVADDEDVGEDDADDERQDADDELDLDDDDAFDGDDDDLDEDDED
jgi:hypothetical protein